MGLYILKDALIQSKILFSDLMFLSIFNSFILNCKLINSDKLKYLEKKYNFKNNKIKPKKIKEMNFNLFIGVKDYNNKIKFINKFFKKGNNVRVFINYRGREKSKKNIINGFIFNLTQILNDNGFLSCKPKFFYKNISLLFNTKWN